jgi:hypothetical protein
VGAREDLVNLKAWLMDKIKIEILKEHLPYELDMLDTAVAYLQSAESSSSEESLDRATRFRRNAAIEAFWTHARNLVEFLTREKSGDLTVSSASAKDFAEKFHPTAKMEPIQKKINEQVTHFGFCRKSSQDEKLGGDDMNWVKPAIDSEIKRFETLLDPECRAYWVKRGPVVKPLVIDGRTASFSSTLTSVY